LAKKHPYAATRTSTIQLASSHQFVERTKAYVQICIFAIDTFAMNGRAVQSCIAGKAASCMFRPYHSC
jgi:hypothetical protein